MTTPSSPNPERGSGQPRSGGGSSGGSRSRSRSGSRNRSRGGSGGSGQQRSGGGGQHRSGSQRNRSNQRSRSGGGGQRRPAAPVAAAAVVLPPLLGAATSEVTPAEVQANQRRAATLCLVAGLVPGVVLGLVLGLVVGWLVGLVALVVVTAAVAWLVGRLAPGRLLARLGTRAPRAHEAARLDNLLDGLCATFGVPVPAVAVVDDPAPNACAVGRDPSTAVLVVTTGLLRELDLMETEGVVAHELAHVKRHDTVVAGVVALALAPLSGLGMGDALAHRLLGPGREYRADQIAATAVRYPSGLHDALAVMDAAADPGPASLFASRKVAATRWLWIDPMVGRRHEPVAGQLDATSVRRDALAEW